MLKRCRRWLTGVVLVLGAGCAHTSQFPTPAQLEALATTPVEAPTAPRTVPVERWTLLGPLPTSILTSPWAPSGPVEQALATGAVAAGARPNAALACVAREMAHFWLETGGEPEDALQRFIEARCTSPVAVVRSHSLYGDVTDEENDQALATRWASDIAQLATAEAHPERPIAGAFLRGKGKAMLMLVTGELAVAMDAAPLTPADGELVLRGRRVGPDTQNLSAEVNQGAFGVRHCVDEQLAPPAFGFRCPLEATDATAFADIFNAKPGQLLSTSVLSVAALPSGTAGDTWELPALAVPDAASASQTFGDAVNALRAKGGMGTLAVDSAQSTVATRLLPHFFSRDDGGAHARKADLVALGMLAGWEVSGSVTRGHFSAGRLAGHGANVPRSVMALTQHPGARAALFAPAASRLAVGVQPVGSDMGAIFSTYELYAPADSEKLGLEALRRVNERRAAKGLPTAKLVRLPGGGTEEAERRLRAGDAPDDVANQMLQESASILHRPVRGGWADVNSEHPFVLPDEIALQSTLDLQVVTGFHKPSGEPWGHLVVVYVTSAPPAPTMAWLGVELTGASALGL